ncbi:MAG TPA: ATP-binding cassette domain-containing protein [Verrucomicrobiae bacterium]|nr:ATP-binding cassette domain-containing protein [Verrucomicrobiae bacterium]
MKLRLQNVRLPLAHFVLELDAEITGQVAAIFGSSGAGKTSVLDLIAGLRRAQSARIELDGRTLTDTGHRVFVPARQRGIGYVPQDGALFPHLSVRHNLQYGAPRHTVGESKSQFAHVLEVLEIGGLVDRRPQSLSGGEKQRVALARALLSAPRLLLLDEPLAALDQPLKLKIMPYLQRVRDEFRVPMIYVTHNASEVVALCDEVLVIDRGKQIRHGAPGELFTISEEPQFVLKSQS